MAIVAKGTTRKLIPAGNYFGVCVGIFDIGVQDGGQYDPKHQIILQWELHKKKGLCRDEDGNPLRYSSFYTLAFGDKASLRKDVEKMLGRKFTPAEAKNGYDVTELLDTACRLTISHQEINGGMKDVIDSFMPLDEDDVTPAAETSSVVYEFGALLSDDVPEWVQKIVKKSPDWSESSSKSKAAPARSGGGDDDNDDETPF